MICCSLENGPKATVNAATLQLYVRKGTRFEKSTCLTDTFCDSCSPVTVSVSTAW